MTKVSEPGIGQGDLIPREVLPPALPPDFDTKRVRTFSHMISVIGEYVDLSKSTTTEQDLKMVEPASIERGLYISRLDRDRKAKGVYDEVVLPPDQFLVVARSPRDLAIHTFERALAANTKKPEGERESDRDKLRAKASRAAGHVLEVKIVELDKLHLQISEERLALKGLLKAIRGGGRAYYRADNLDEMRKIGTESIHKAIEVAAINTPDLNSMEVDNVQSAVRYNLYGHQHHNNRRMAYWEKYVLMAGTYARRRLDVLDSSRHLNLHELAPYQKYLDAENE